MFVINHHLLHKLRAKIIDAEIGVGRCTERHIIGHVAPESPGVFKNVVVERSDKTLTGGKHADIVN